ncbi:MAG: WYL domain-containing protein [Bacteroidetes bacterium]|nr:WYL domain-containing protein [Bacteroidota bacterium]
MPSNKSALRRYRLLDQAFRNRQRPFPSKQELIDLIEEKTGETIGVRTLEQDIADMRYDTGLGYNAPIEYNKTEGGYYYSDPDYSITGIPISQEDLEKLKIAAGILSRFTHVPYLSEIYVPVQQLERILSIGQNTGKWTNNQVVQMEIPDQAVDMDLFETCIQCIQHKQMLELRYTPYGGKESRPFIVYPFLLKEYRNRWYLVAHNRGLDDIRIYGLDRISRFKKTADTFETPFDAEDYFKHAFGITVYNGEKPTRVELLFQPEAAPYVLSTQLHPSLKILHNHAKGLRITLEVHVSAELLMLIRSYGSGVQVLKPRWLKQQILEDAEKVVKGRRKGFSQNMKS